MNRTSKSDKNNFSTFLLVRFSHTQKKIILKEGISKHILTRPRSTQNWEQGKSVWTKGDRRRRSRERVKNFNFREKEKHTACDRCFFSRSFPHMIVPTVLYELHWTFFYTFGADDLQNYYAENASMKSSLKNKLVESDIECIFLL